MKYLPASVVGSEITFTAVPDERVWAEDAVALAEQHVEEAASDAEPLAQTARDATVLAAQAVEKLRQATIVKELAEQRLAEAPDNISHTYTNTDEQGVVAELDKAAIAEHFAEFKLLAEVETRAPKLVDPETGKEVSG